MNRANVQPTSYPVQVLEYIAQEEFYGKEAHLPTSQYQVLNGFNDVMEKSNRSCEEVST